MELDLQAFARALGGEVSGNQVLVPGPGHSGGDRSLSVKLEGTAPQGFMVHSFSGDDPLVCRDYVCAKVGLPAFKPTGSRRPVVEEIEAAVMTAASARRPPPQKIV